MNEDPRYQFALAIHDARYYLRHHDYAMACFRLAHAMERAYEAHWPEGKREKALHLAERLFHKAKNNIDQLLAAQNECVLQ